MAASIASRRAPESWSTQGSGRLDSNRCVSAFTVASVLSLSLTTAARARTCTTA